MIPDSHSGESMLAHELEEIRRHRMTGTLFIVSSENRQGRMYFEEGRPFSLDYHVHKDERAADNLQYTQIVKFRFAPGAVPMARKSEASVMGNVLRKLLNRSAPAAAGGVESGGQVVFISPKAQTIIREALVEYLGPMGDFLYDDLGQKYATLDALLQALAEEFSDPREARRFIATVNQQLGVSGPE